MHGSSAGEDATAETEPLAGAAAPAAVPARTGRRRGGIVAALVLVLALVVAATLLFTLLRPGADLDAGTATDPSPTQTAETSPTPEGEAAPPVDAESEPEAQPEEQQPAPPAATAEQRAVEAVSGYYALLPGDRDGAWPLMTADYQENHAGGRGGYEAFWAPITGLEIADVVATAPDQVQATLTYYYDDGRVVQEVTSYSLVEEAGVLKIAATDVLSSTEL